MYGLARHASFSSAEAGRTKPLVQRIGTPGRRHWICSLNSRPLIYGITRSVIMRSIGEVDVAMKSNALAPLLTVMTLQPKDDSTVWPIVSRRFLSATIKMGCLPPGSAVNNAVSATIFLEVGR